MVGVVTRTCGPNIVKSPRRLVWAGWARYIAPSTNRVAGRQHLPPSPDAVGHRTGLEVGVEVRQIANAVEQYEVHARRRHVRRRGQKCQVFRACLQAAGNGDDPRYVVIHERQVIAAKRVRPSPSEACEWAS